jgi:hypothetical protein
MITELYDALPSHTKDAIGTVAFYQQGLFMHLVITAIGAPDYWARVRVVFVNNGT